MTAPNPTSHPAPGVPVQPPHRPGIERDFADVYAEHFDFVWRTVRRLGVPERSLDDAAQDVFIVVHRRLPDFEGRSSIRSWVFAIHHGWGKKINPVAAYKAGMRKIEDLHPLVELGVKNGLTLGDIQDWSEMELRDHQGFTERLVKNQRQNPLLHCVWGNEAWNADGPFGHGADEIRNWKHAVSRVGFAQVYWPLTAMC